LPPLVQIGLRRSFSGKKFLDASGIYFCEFERGLRIRQVAFGLSDSCLKERRIDLGDYLAGFYLGIKIHKQLRDIS
jgi:hypothetical protein